MFTSVYIVAYVVVVLVVIVGVSYVCVVNCVVVYGMYCGVGVAGVGMYVTERVVGVVSGNDGDGGAVG